MFRALFVAFLITIGLQAAAAPADWKIYENNTYGFRMVYPATSGYAGEWSIFGQVKTPYREQGLQPVFTLCLTPGPVKTLSCQDTLYVIPEAKFVPPSKDRFLDLPTKAGFCCYSAEPSWGYFRGEPFLTIDGNVSLINHIARFNGFVYLWTYPEKFFTPHGGQEGTMLKSVRFFVPGKWPEEKARCDTATSAKEWPNPFITAGPYAIDVDLGHSSGQRNAAPGGLVLMEPNPGHFSTGRSGMSADALRDFLANDILPLDWPCGRAVGIQKKWITNSDTEKGVEKNYAAAIRVLNELKIKINSQIQE